jgi:hypothetical protein
MKYSELLGEHGFEQNAAGSMMVYQCSSRQQAHAEYFKQ